jgi:hypothetical protein
MCSGSTTGKSDLQSGYGALNVILNVLSSISSACVTSA